MVQYVVLKQDATKLKTYSQQGINRLDLMYSCNIFLEMPPLNSNDNIIDVLWGQPIKQNQVASTSELCENQRNDLLFFEIVPYHFWSKVADFTQ